MTVPRQVFLVAPSILKGHEIVKGRSARIDRVGTPIKYRTAEGHSSRTKLAMFIETPLTISGSISVVSLVDPWPGITHNSVYHDRGRG